jgi:hypothetical protein
VDLVVALVVALALLPAYARAEPASDWSVNGWLAAYVRPDAGDYLQPTVGLDRGRLHLEARYDYEDLRTGSLFVGWRYQTGDQAKLGLVPVLGAVVGRTAGIAPGLLLDLSWGRFALHTESEYVLATRASSFFYAWSELGVTLGPVEAGLVVQRTRIVQTPREVALGPWVRATWGPAALSLYLFDPFDPERFVVAAVSLEL